MGEGDNTEIIAPSLSPINGTRDKNLKKTADGNNVEIVWTYLNEAMSE